ncbi:MAG: IS256 family transposase [Terriglobales bacterium]
MKEQSRNEAVESSQVCYATLEPWARSKVQEFLQQVLEEELTALLGREKHGRRESVSPVDPPQGSRNGHGKPRKFTMMNGTVIVRRPRARDLEERFVSKILPLFKRRSHAVGDLLPELYLHGLSTGDFELALRGLLGDGAPLSASSIQRLKARFELEYAAWKQRDLSQLEVVYMWADGLYVRAGIEDRKAALLTIVCALSTGEKVLLACESGERESKESWLKVLRDLTARGLKLPKVTVADGHLGIWAALGELHPEGAEQRCWNHKIVNVLDDLPKKEQPQAAELLKAMPYAATRAECEQRRDQFALRYKKTDPKAVATLLRDWERMVTFYSFPKDHWRHLRTTNIVESPFSAVRLRTEASRRYKRVEGAKAIIWKVLRVAETTWRKLNSPELLPLVASGVRFQDGVRDDGKLDGSESKFQPKAIAA